MRWLLHGLLHGDGRRAADADHTGTLRYGSLRRSRDGHGWETGGEEVLRVLLLAAAPPCAGGGGGLWEGVRWRGHARRCCWHCQRCGWLWLLRRGLQVRVRRWHLLRINVVGF